MAWPSSSLTLRESTRSKPKSSSPQTIHDLIPVVNKLQDVLLTARSHDDTGTFDIELPQIVVVGGQSSGKSSVLENIVGRDFLPRGSGIVTRRPLVLQLINIDEADGPDYGEFLHAPNIRFEDFDNIREEIELETDRATGHNKGISHAPISLRVYSSSVLNLTLVDLPGMTKVPVGDQPADIQDRIKDMILTYITNPGSIILAVTPANTDLANSDGLQLAREVDPEGVRTLGVITKLDLMDQGTDASAVLNGHVIPLQLGYIGVVNRSQKDIMEKRSIKDSLLGEIEYFRNHPAYSPIASRQGTSYLARTMNKILMKHIRAKLPEVKQRVNAALQKTQEELTDYGSPMPSKIDKGMVLLEIITSFATQFRDAINGTMTNIETNELFGGARISYIFHEVFNATMDQLDPLDGLSAADIRTAMRNATGTRPSLFVPEISFELLVKRQIKKLEDPSLRCVELVFEELLRIVEQCQTKEIQRFEALSEQVRETVTSLIKNRVPTTLHMIESIISIETSYINTNHPDFVSYHEMHQIQLAQLAKENQELILKNMRQQQSMQSGKRHEGTKSSTSMGGPQHQHSQHGAAAYSPDTHPPNAPYPAKDDPPAPSGPVGATASADVTAINAQAITGRPFSIASLFAGRAPDPTPPPVAPPPTRAAHSERPHSEEGEGADERVAALPMVQMKLTREDTETELIQNLIRSYFVIVKKNVQDIVPKTVMCLLVNWVNNHIQNELVATLYRHMDHENLLAESEAVVRLRANAEARYQNLKRAANILKEVHSSTLE